MTSRLRARNSEFLVSSCHSVRHCGICTIRPASEDKTTQLEPQVPTLEVVANSTNGIKLTQDTHLLTFQAPDYLLATADDSLDDWDGWDTIYGGVSTCELLNR